MVNSIMFFAVIVILLDLFGNINMYITNDIPLSQIGYLTLLYIPKAISYSISPALMFSITFTISSLHSRNEIVSILNSGISYFRFISSLLFLGLFLSIGGFLFQEVLVIDSFSEKEELTSTIIGYSTSYNNNNVVLISQKSNEVYYARYYNDKRSEISSLIIITRDDMGVVTRRLDAKKATYVEKEQSWMLNDVTIYTIDEMQTLMATEQDIMVLQDENIKPDDLRDITFDIQEMKIQDAKLYIERLRYIDFKKFLSLQTDYYERFAFSLTPLIVVIISCSLGSRFKKNILLYSLLLSIIISVFYYIFEMLTILLAKQHYIPPLLGAWLPVVLFGVLSLLMLRKVRT